MEVSLDDFRRHFEILSDDALLATNREDLVESARECYDEEVTRRGLNTPSIEPVAGEPIAEYARRFEAAILDPAEVRADAA